MRQERYLSPSTLRINRAKHLGGICVALIFFLIYATVFLGALVYICNEAMLFVYHENLDSLSSAFLTL